jgi:hypothetical protein
MGEASDAKLGVAATDDKVRDAAGAQPARRRLSREEVVAGQRDRSIEELHATATDNQRLLAGLAADVAGDGVAFVDPGVKSLARIREKVALEGYDDATDLVDLARGAFVVDSPESGERLAQALLRRFDAMDKGWVRMADTGYLDRKIVVAFDNGGTAELQIVPRAVWEAKKAAGNDLYQRSRVASGAGRAALEGEQRALYAAALSDSEFNGIWDRSASGNSRANSSGESRIPAPDALPTSPGASRQPDRGLNAQARSPSRATARSSTSNSSNDVMGDASDPKLGVGGADDKARDAAARAAIAGGGPAEPSVRLDEAGEPVTLRSVMDEFDADAAAIDAARRCL